MSTPVDPDADWDVDWRAEWKAKLRELDYYPEPRFKKQFIEKQSKKRPEKEQPKKKLSKRQQHYIDTLWIVRQPKKRSCRKNEIPKKRFCRFCEQINEGNSVKIPLPPSFSTIRVIWVCTQCASKTSISQHISPPLHFY